MTVVKVFTRREEEGDLRDTRTMKSGEQTITATNQSQTLRRGEAQPESCFLQVVTNLTIAFRCHAEFIFPDSIHPTPIQNI